MDPKNTNTVDQFFNDLPEEDKQTANVFDDKKPDASPEKEEGSSEGKTEDPNESEPRKNRRHRRLEQQVENFRKENIELNALLKNKTEVEKFAKESGGEVDPRIARMFDASDVGKQNAIELTNVIKDMTKNAREEAIQEFEERQREEKRQESQYESFIDSEFENIEDEYGVDLTSDTPAARKTRREFLELVESLSPKNDQGEITEFADFESAFKLYQRTAEKPTQSSERRKGIAATSMQKSGQNGGTGAPAPTPGFRGWMKDFKVS